MNVVMAQHPALPIGDLWQALLGNLPGHQHVWLQELREASLELYQAGIADLLKGEKWKYARLPEPVASDRRAGEGPDLLEVEIAEQDVTRLVFLNGIFNAELSHSLPDGLECKPFSSHWQDADIQRYMRSAHGHAKDAVDALSLALAGDGTYLTLAADVKLSQPLHVVFYYTTEATHAFRHRWLFERGSHAQIIETHLSTLPCWNLHHQLIELEESASVQHLVIQQEHAEATHLLQRRIKQEGFSDYQLTALTLGGKTARQEVTSHLRGAEARSRVTAAHLARDRQQHSHYVAALHEAHHAHSEQQFRSVLDGQARGVFYGKVGVPEHIQHSEAHQLLRAVLLSRSAEADVRPELEILNDDVVCSHGATVGQIDRNALYYLLARGIPEREARKLLISAFVDSLFDENLSESLMHHVQVLVDAWVEKAFDGGIAAGGAV